jgi:hypothetical protein
LAWSLIAFLFLLIPVPPSESRIAQKEGRYAEANMNFFSTPSFGITASQTITTVEATVAESFQLPLSGSLRIALSLRRS